MRTNGVAWPPLAHLDEKEKWPVEAPDPCVVVKYEDVPAQKTYKGWHQSRGLANLCMPRPCLPAACVLSALCAFRQSFSLLLVHASALPACCLCTQRPVCIPVFFFTAAGVHCKVHHNRTPHLPNPRKDKGGLRASKEKFQTTDHICWRYQLLIAAGAKWF